jgi:hypothetical protein
VILSFQASILLHDGVYFATTNNKYEKCKRGRGSEGFARLFAAVIPRIKNWTAVRGTHEDNETTCEQAEVLYPVSLSTDYLQKIYVRNEDDCDRVRAWLLEFDHANVEVVINLDKFKGADGP